MAVEQPKPRPEGLGKQPKYTQGQGLGDVELRADLESFMYGNPLARLGYELYKEGKIDLKTDKGRGRVPGGSYGTFLKRYGAEKTGKKQNINFIQTPVKETAYEDENYENADKELTLDPRRVLVHELTHAAMEAIEARERNRLRNLNDEYAFEGKPYSPRQREGFNKYGGVDYEEAVVRAGDELITGRLSGESGTVGIPGLQNYISGSRISSPYSEAKLKNRFISLSTAAQDLLEEKGVAPEAIAPSDNRARRLSYAEMFKHILGFEKERNKLNNLGFGRVEDGNVYRQDAQPSFDRAIKSGRKDPSSTNPFNLKKGAALMTMPLTEATSNPTGNKPRKEKKLPQRGAKPDNSRVDPRDEALKLVAKNMKQKTQKGIAAPTAPAPMMTAGQMPPPPTMNTGLAAPAMPMTPEEPPMPIMAAKGKALEDGGKSRKKGKGLAVVIDMGSAEKPEYEEASMGTPSDPPPGATADEVKDNQHVLLSEGELVVPANVVRYHGLGMYEGLRRDALQGLGEMEDAGQVEYIDDGIKTAAAGMTIMNAPNVATSQGIARQQQQFTPGTAPEAASAKFVSTGFVDKNRDGVDDKMQKLSLPVPTSPVTTTSSGLRLGPTTNPNMVVGAGNVGSYKDEQKNPGDDDGTTPPKDDTPAPVTPTKVIQQDSGGDDGGDPEISAGLGGARTTIGGVEYAVQYDFSGNIIGLANVADALSTGKANFTVPNPDVIGLIEQQTAGQKAIGSGVIAPVANAFGLLEGNKEKIAAGKTATAALDAYRGQVGMRPQDLPMGRPSQAVIDAYAQEKINPNALAAPELKALTMPANYEEQVGSGVGTSDAGRLAELQAIQNTISASPEGKPIYSDSLGGALSKEEAEFLTGMTDTITASDRPRAASGIEDVPTQSQMDRDTAFREAAEAKSRKEAREAQMVGIGMGFAASTVAPGTATNDAIQGKGYSSTGAAPAGSQYSSTGTFSTDSSDDDTGVGSSGDLGGSTGAGYGAGSEGTDSSDDESTGSTGSNVSQTGGTSGVSYADDAQSSGSGGGGGGCVIATHGLSTGGFTVMEKAKAELWCQKTYHGKWYGEAFRRGYKAAGMKHVNAGTAPSVYQEFKDFVAYGRGIKKGWKAGLNYYFRTISFFITGLFIK